MTVKNEDVQSCFISNCCLEISMHINLLPSIVIESHPGVLIVNMTELDGRPRESRQKGGHNESSGEPEPHPAAGVLPAVRDGGSPIFTSRGLPTVAATKLHCSQCTGS